MSTSTMVADGTPYSRHHQPSSASASWQKKKQSPTILLRFMAMATTAVLIQYSASCRVFPIAEAKVHHHLPLLPSSVGASGAAAGARVVAAEERYGIVSPTLSAFFVPRRRSSKSVLSVRHRQHMHDVMVKIRGGVVEDNTDSDEEDELEDNAEVEEREEESSDDEYDSEEEEEEDDDDEEVVQQVKQTSSSLLKSSMLSKSSSQKKSGEISTSIEYDTLLTPPAMQQLFITIGVMLLSNRIDILDAKAVRITRIAFVSYIIVVQLFLLYVRLKAKSMNDRTPVMISSPLASLLPAAVTGGGGAGGGGNSMVKTLADQVLSTQTTILEYDLKQAKQMNGSLLFPMIFNYFLHFKMKQVQPLIMQTATGMMNLVYSPLFQVYVLGRNLERPFKQPTNPMMDALQQQQQQEQDEEGEGEVDDSAVVEDVEEEGEDGEDEEGEENDEEDENDDDEYDNSDDE